MNRQRPIERHSSGRWLAGVCAGLADVWGQPVGRIRAVFVLAALAGGLGTVVYLACSLIIPADDEHGERASSRGVIVLAEALAACAGLVVLAVLAATATVFGFGWLVALLAAAVLAGMLTVGRRLGPAWSLLPIAALTLPAAAIAMSDVRLAPSSGAAVVAPRTLSARTTEYRSGLGTLLVDLRHTQLPAGGIVRLRIDAGLRRTIVALPETSCVRAAVQYDVHPFAGQLAALLTGRTVPPFSDLVLFGRVFGARSVSPRGVAVNEATAAGPVLKIDFSSQGGSLFVRDYPDQVDPDADPNWPGFTIHLEPRPNLAGVTRRAARYELAAWRGRLRTQQSQARTIDTLMPGPCVAQGRS